MSAELITLDYHSHPIEFSVNGDVMINANQMEKPFGKRARDYTKLESTKEFVKALCQSGNLRFEDEFSPTGKYVKARIGGRNPGTWLHRHVALDFAMWLDPMFRVWVMQTIDQLIFERKQERNSYFENRKQLYEDYKQADRKMRTYKADYENSSDYRNYLLAKDKKKELKEKLNDQDQKAFEQTELRFQRN